MQIKCFVAFSKAVEELSIWVFQSLLQVLDIELKQ